MKKDNERDRIPAKPIKVNSIKDSSIKRILKPCEARAGHGVLLTFVYLAVIMGAITIVVKGFVWIYRWIAR